MLMGLTWSQSTTYTIGISVTEAIQISRYPPFLAPHFRSAYQPGLPDQPDSPRPSEGIIA